jgi:hypothetical protein
MLNIMKVKLYSGKTNCYALCKTSVQDDILLCHWTRGGTGFTELGRYYVSVENLIEVTNMCYKENYYDGGLGIYL